MLRAVLYRTVGGFCLEHGQVLVGVGFKREISGYLICSAGVWWDKCTSQLVPIGSDVNNHQYWLFQVDATTLFGLGCLQPKLMLTTCHALSLPALCFSRRHFLLANNSSLSFFCQSIQEGSCFYVA